MEGTEGSPPQSLCMIRAAELFPKPQMEKEDTELTVPFQELSGESVKYLARTDDGILALSNYRIFILENGSNTEISVPLGLIDTVQTRDLFHLIISCKDASTVKCSFETAEQCAEAQRRVQLSVGVPQTLDSLFAFPFCSWTCDGLNATSLPAMPNGGNYISGGTLENLPNSTNFSACSQRLQRTSNCEDELFLREVERLGFDLKSAWRISNANEDFKLCASYPQKILVPSCIPDEVLQKVANFRGSRRLPAVVWRHRKSGAVIARCSQPEVGWLGWRNAEDEMLLKAIADASAFDRGEEFRRLPQVSAPATSTEQTNSKMNTYESSSASTAINYSNSVYAMNGTSINASVSDESSTSSPDGSHEEVPLDLVRKVLIVDARSYTSAVTNRARGGGCECIEYYTCAEIEFMNLGNIHAIRKSFHALRQLCASPADTPNWFTMLEKTMWFHHLSGLLAATVTICHNIEKRGRPVLVHCSDGWDRTPQLVATAQLCLDPYYRTMEGFRVLVEREFLSFGHKFADRCGHGPGSDELNERCPVFLQWIDLVHQIHKQFPCSFEFNMGYLIKLAQHSHSCLFGTFLCNTLKERIENSIFERTFSVWPFISGSMYKNPLYVPNREKVLWPAHNVRDLELWTEVYLGSLGNQNCSDMPMCNGSEGNTHVLTSPVVKTRSYGDLITGSITQNGISRRSSDPNMSIEPNLAYSENASVADVQSEREDSPDIITNLIHDTTRKLQNLTIELNSQNDEEIVAVNANSFQQQQTINGNYFDIDKISHRSQEPLINLNLTSNGANEAAKLETTNDINKLTEKFKTRHNTDETLQGVNECDYHLRYNNDSSQSTSHVGIVVQKTVDFDVQSAESSADVQNIWHGLINTSTDTLVPMENSNANYDHKACDEHANIAEGAGFSSKIHKQPAEIENAKTNFCNSSTITGILPKVHNHKSKVNCTINANIPTATYNETLSNDVSSILSSASSSLHNLHEINLNEHALLNQNVKSTYDVNSTENILKNFLDENQHLASNNVIDENKLVSLDHRKPEISLSGECDTFSNDDDANGTTQTMFVSTATASNEAATSVYAESATPASNAPSFSYSSTPTLSQRPRRMSSANPKRADLNAKLVFGGSTMPMTPSGILPERSQIAISCPDGLAHALSEQNLRLQQIIYEHKVREDALVREIHDMRMALLKRVCPNCNYGTTTNDEQCSMTENVENGSVCSWEAVEDRSGPSSHTTSMQNTTIAPSVLWVPDHAVSRCASCHTEFWLGRRKHHCRSCGQIFCADCSEFWAPLPNEKLFSPVRLCGSCYYVVTTRLQPNPTQQTSGFLQSQQQQQSERNKNQSPPNHHHCNESTKVVETNASAVGAGVAPVSNVALMTATSQA